MSYVILHENIFFLKFLNHVLLFITKHVTEIQYRDWRKKTKLYAILYENFSFKFLDWIVLFISKEINKIDYKVKKKVKILYVILPENFTFKSNLIKNRTLRSQMYSNQQIFENRK